MSERKRRTAPPGQTGRVGRLYETPKSARTPAQKARLGIDYTWRVLRAVILAGCALLIVTAIGLYAWDIISGEFDPAEPGGKPIELYIRRGSTVDSIAKLLEEEGIIKSARAFKLYLDFTGLGSELKAGSYWLDGGMTFQQIAEKMAQGDGGRSIVNLLVTEGSTITQIAKSAVELGLFETEEKFLQACKTASLFIDDYAFIGDLDTEENGQRYYMLEGYLFPAKYELYADTTEEALIRKMLNKFGTMMTDEFLQRCNEMDMTIDQVVTLASIIEREAKEKDFKKVSAVFHNRLKRGEILGTDVTQKYILGKGSISGSLLVGGSSAATAGSPYDTYARTGLPLGPVGNPGIKAIEAALYPDETTMAEGYLFFILKDPATGELEFNKTQAAHDAARVKYEPLWREYEATYGQN